jgi:transcriptional regulator with XRE-family HTH domain
MKILGEVLRRKRLEKKLTLGELAEMAGITSTLIWEIEKGRKIPLKGKSLREISDCLGLDYLEVFAIALETKFLVPQYRLKQKLIYAIVRTENLSLERIEKILEILSPSGK